MQVESIASAILSTDIKLQFIFKTFVLSIFEWPFYTGFTVPFKSFCTQNGMTFRHSNLYIWPSGHSLYKDEQKTCLFDY